jgi:hypothetical protein
MMAEGHVVYSPIAHSHPIAEVSDLPGGWEFWQKQCLEMLSHASRLVVAQMDGWEDSVGIKAEIDMAVEWRIPLTYLAIEGKHAT